MVSTRKKSLHKEIIAVATTPNTSKAQVVQDLLDFEDDDNDFEAFKSAPVNQPKLDIPSPQMEKRFNSNNSDTPQNNRPQGETHLIDLYSIQPEGPQSTTAGHNSSNFSFTNSSSTYQSQPQPQQSSFRPPTTVNNSTSVDSSKLYDLYKSTPANQTTPNQNFNTTSGAQGRQSNYSYLEMMSNQPQQQPQQMNGLQNGQNSSSNYQNHQGRGPQNFNGVYNTSSQQGPTGINQGFGSYSSTINLPYGLSQQQNGLQRSNNSYNFNANNQTGFNMGTNLGFNSGFNVSSNSGFAFVGGQNGGNAGVSFF